jgi:hypothetical protein
VTKGNPGVQFTEEHRANISTGLMLYHKRRIVENDKRLAAGLPIMTNDNRIMENRYRRRRYQTIMRRLEKRALMERAKIIGRWQPPAEFKEWYREFTSQFGAKEARRLIEDHVAAVQKRQGVQK